MKLNIVTEKQPALVNLNSRVPMNTKDLSGIATVKRIKLQNTVGKQITTLSGISRKLMVGNSG